MSPTLFARRCGALVAAAALASSALMVPAASAQEVSSTYLANLDASGVQIHVDGEGIPIASVVEVSPWAALGGLDNTQSVGQAGAPYLGDFITPLLGTVNGLGGGGTNLPPVPTLPGYVSSSFPQDPKASQQNVGFLISSESEARAFTSRVQVGAPPVGGEGNSTLFATAHADFDPGAGVLTAHGESGLEALNIAGVVKIGRVASSVHIVDRGDGRPKVDVTTDISAVTVAGLPVGIDEKGVSVLGNSLPLTAPVNRVVNDSLRSAGVSLRLVPAESAVDESTGVTALSSAALEVGFSAEFPVVGLVNVKLTIGRVFAQFLNEPFANATSPPSLVLPAPVSQPGLAPPAFSPTGAPLATTVSSGLSNVAFPGGAPAPPAPPRAAQDVVPVASGVPDSTSLRWIYLILVLAGIGMVGPATLLERAGFVARRIWR